jgi:Leucine-rich repeat (LRR) protein
MANVVTFPAFYTHILLKMTTAIVRHRYDALTRELYIHHYNVTAIPADIIPTDTKILKCSANALTDLPDKLPNKLHTLNCVDNKLTCIKSATLPRKLYEFNCYKNKITNIEPGLPPNLKRFDCSENLLTRLPELPQNLQILQCCQNKLTVLPDLPDTLFDIFVIESDDKTDITLLVNYPELLIYQNDINNAIDDENDYLDNDYNTEMYPERLARYHSANISSKIHRFVTYVNDRNVVIRQQERSRIINANNILLESYMRRAMHPSRLTALVENDDLDVDEYMTAYVETL